MRETKYYFDAIFGKVNKTEACFCVFVLIVQCCYYLLFNLSAGDGGETRDSHLC